MRNALKKLANLLIGVCLISYFGLVAFFYFAQSNMLFKNHSAIENANIDKLKIQDIRIKTPDGETLQAFYEPAMPNRPTILFFHGQGGGLELQKWRFYRLHKQGFGFLSIAYRGFSQSSGKPSEKGLFIDGLSAFDELVKIGVLPKDIIIHGHSLGSGVATYVASKRDAKALILETPFSAAVEVAQERFPWLPVGLLMKNRFESTKYIKEVNAPILIVTGGKDQVIPAKFGRKLYEFAPSPKQYVYFQNSNHNTMTKDGIYPVIFSFLKVTDMDFAKDIIIEN